MDEKKKNIWIFGGTGFVGKSLITYLSRIKNYQLHILIHNNAPYKFLEPYNTFTGNFENFDLKWLELYPPDLIFYSARLGGRNRLVRIYRSIKSAKANNRLIEFLIKTLII